MIWNEIDVFQSKWKSLLDNIKVGLSRIERRTNFIYTQGQHFRLKFECKVWFGVDGEEYFVWFLS